MQSPFAPWNDMHPQSCGNIKKEEKKENCSNISQSLGSFKNPTADTNTQVLTYGNAVIHTLTHKSVHSYPPPVLTMVRLQTRAYLWLTKYKVALRCTLLKFSHCSDLLFASVSLKFSSSSSLFALHDYFNFYDRPPGQLTQPRCHPDHLVCQHCPSQSNQVWLKWSPCPAVPALRPCLKALTSWEYKASYLKAQDSHNPSTSCSHLPV